MEAVFTVLNKLMIIFFLILIGYGCRKKKIVDDSFMEGIAGFLTRIIIPCFVISSLQIDYTPELFRDGATVFIVCVIMHIWGLIVGWLSFRFLKVPQRAKGIWIFSCMFANIGFMGVPVISMIFGGSSVFYCAFASFAFNITAYTLGVMVLDKCTENSDSSKVNMKQLLKAPVNVATVVGILLFVMNVRLPEPMKDTVDMVGGMLSPLAMIYIGGILGKFDFKETVTEKWAYAVSFFRLIFMPLSSYFILKPFIHDKLILGVIVVGLSTPIGAFCAILAAEFGADEELASKYIFVTTLLCIFTMPVFFMLFL
ncbi:AEC family transporter [Anaerotignum sp.]|uniref:AEC family transporter n=1 Tax=Anaerotignum sp. TaxID=2039241 RepID=UPI0033264243